MKWLRDPKQEDRNPRPTCGASAVLESGYAGLAIENPAQNPRLTSDGGLGNVGNILRSIQAEVCSIGPGQTP